MALIQFHGPNYGTANYYTSPNTESPKMFANVWWDITRSSERDPYINVQFSGEIFRLAGNYGSSRDPVTGNYGPNCPNSSWESYYGYYLNLYLSANGVDKLVAVKGSSPSQWTTSIGYQAPSSFSVYWPSNNPLPIVLKVRGGCSSGGCSAGNYDNNFVNASVPNYNPYTPPSIWLNPDTSTKIGILNVTDYLQHYSMTQGTNTIQGTKAELWNDDVNGSWKWGKDYNRTGTNYDCWDSYKLTSENGFTDGSRYRMSISVHDDRGTWVYSPGSFLNTYFVYTYRTPIINTFNISNSNFSGIGNTTLSWSTNGRKWANFESDFKTYYSFNNGSNWYECSNNRPTLTDTNALSNISQALDKSIIDNCLTVNDRSCDTLSNILIMKRVNVTSGVETLSSSKNYTIQFKPKYTPSRMEFVNTNNNQIITPGSLVYVNDIPSINVRWYYPDNTDRGVINGYIVRVYTDNTKTELVNEYTVPVNVDTLTASKLINTNTDLVRGSLNYITISAYYTKPNNSGNVEGNTLESNFIIPTDSIVTPVINYPINNTIWHNNQFRILFELPEDRDLLTYTQEIQNGAYRYRNIELKINDQIFSFTSGTENMSNNTIVAPEIFSTTNLEYRKKIVINPSISTQFITNNRYSISIRVQKNYYVPIWSDWSTSTNITITSIENLNTDREYPVLLEHYKYVRDNTLRLNNTYPIIPSTQYNSNRAVGDIINITDFQYMYTLITNIQQGVNNWTTFDNNRQNVKFNQIINEFDTPNEIRSGDIITSSLNGSVAITGRNYFNILINCMNKLY